MKRNASIVILFFLLLIVALVFSAAQISGEQPSATPSPWLPPLLTPDPVQPIPTPGWWNSIPTPIPFPTPTPRR